jgi:GNAT superfamily N-acetyltransferase/uncharacterized protein YndB with AHSA1/START domain
VTAARHKIDLPVSPEAVWAALVAPERRHWYYDLALDGSVEPGSHLRWLDTDGDPMEESDVLAADPPRHLELRSRFLFAPHVADADPHRLSWTITPAPDGCRVELTVDGARPGVELLVNEGDLVLRGLRLALDPAVGAALARRPEIGPVEVRDVTAERVPDYQAFFDHDAFADFPAWQACYCIAPHHADGQPEGTRDENRRRLSEMLAGGRATALLAYADGKPVGWCQYGDTTALAAIMHRFQTEAGSLEGVGSIACFVVAAPYRGHGVASRLLEAALDRLRDRGLRVAEAYPPAESRSAQAMFRGPLEMYRRAGFEPYREAGPTLVVRKAL